ncbi:MAG: hypothetical protein KHW75_11095 [[Eubacterium] rectale]|nr:hypothetical protein [Agathobacter rectalis]
MKKKLLITLLALTMAVSSAACTSSKNTSKTDKTEKKATESVAESVTETSTESTAVNEAVKEQESSEVSDTAAGVKADDSIAAGAATTDSRADSDNESSSAGTSADKEKSQKKAKDNKKSASSASAVSSNGSTASNNGSAASNAASSNHTKPTSAAGGKGTDSSAGTANKPAAHTHTWVKYVANTIQHKEEGHYETKVVKEAYDEPQYSAMVVCGCGKAFNTVEEWADHQIDDDCILGYSVKNVEVGKIHHDAETTQVWVVDKPAYTEYVYGEKCSGCGATK